MGTYDFQKIKIMPSDIIIYAEHITPMLSIEWPESIKKPKIAVPNAVEKTIKEPVKALIDPRKLTP